MSVLSHFGWAELPWQQESAGVKTGVRKTRTSRLARIKARARKKWAPCNIRLQRVSTCARRIFGCVKLTKKDLSPSLTYLKALLALILIFEAPFLDILGVGRGFKKIENPISHRDNSFKLECPQDCNAKIRWCRMQMMLACHLPRVRCEATYHYICLVRVPLTQKSIYRDWGCYHRPTITSTLTFSAWKWSIIFHF